MMNKDTKNRPKYELVFDENQMEGVYGVSLVSDPAIGIKALKFSNENEISDDVIDMLLSKGEDISHEYELIDVKEVNESVVNIDLSGSFVVPNSEPDESENDNEIFKVRYRYSPLSTSSNSRPFCVKMVNANKLYKKEDLVWSNANPGFGPRGINSYNLMYFKGGVNCKHFFQREIYLKKNNKKMSVFEALKYIQEKDLISKSKFKQDDERVKQTASASNNYWKLSSELKDFKLSNEEKRILVSPVLIPNQLIYRNFDGEECDVYLSEETISKLQQNFFKNQYQKNSTLEHLEVIDGVFFFESWLIEDPKNDKSNALGYDLPKGTWMMSMKVENEDIWNEYVKTGLISGFSIDSKLGVVKNKNKNNKEEMNYSKVKDKVMKTILMESEMKEIQINDELTIKVEKLEKDFVVFVGDVPFVGEFEFEGNKYSTDENGVIVNIEPIETNDVDMEDESTESTEPSKEDELKKENDELKTRIEELETENQSLKAELVNVKEEVVEMSSKVQGINLSSITSTKEKSINEKSPLESVRDLLKRK